MSINTFNKYIAMLKHINTYKSIEYGHQHMAKFIALHIESDLVLRGKLSDYTETALILFMNILELTYF